MLLFAAALRLWRVGQGLPVFYDEAIPFRRALEMWTARGTDWNPHFFHYPSLTLYLCLALQKLVYLAGHARGLYATPGDFLLRFEIDPTPVLMVARLVFVSIDLATVALTIRIGERLRPGTGLIAGIVAAAASTLVTTSYRLSADTVLAALALLALDRLLAWSDRPGPARLAGVAVLIGAAAGAKYPGAMLLLPAALVMLARRGAAGLRAWLAAAAGAALVFLATTPFSVLDRATFLRDLGFVRNLAQEGHFGNFERIGLGFDVRVLVSQLGAPAALLLALSPFLILSRRFRPANPTGDAWVDRAALWAALLAFFVPSALARVEASRYLLPVIPLAALLAAEAALALASSMPARRAAAIAAVLLMTVPALVAGVPAAGRINESTRSEAAAWIDTHLGPHEVMLQEPLGAPALERFHSLGVISSPRFADARDATRRAYLGRPWKAVVTMPMAFVGRPVWSVLAPGGRWIEIPVAARITELNRVVYDPRLLGGVDYVLTSSALRARHEAEPSAYPEAMRFYALLDSTAERAAHIVSPTPGSGPEIVIYRLTARTRARVDSAGPLPVAWWTEAIAPQYAAEATRRLSGSTAVPPDSPVGADGEPVAWVASLSGLFADRWSDFALALAFEHLERGDAGRARRLAGAVLLMKPEDVRACLTYAAADARLDERADERRVIERTLRALEAGGEPTGVLRLEYAGVLEALGDRAAARSELERVVREGDARSAGQARARLAASRPG